MSTIFIDGWPWWAGGLALGLFVVLYTWVLGRLFGMSSNMESALREWKAPLLPKAAPALSMDDAVWAMVRERGLDPAEFGLSAPPVATAGTKAPRLSRPVELNPRLLLGGVILGATLNGIVQANSGFGLGPSFEALFPFGIAGQGAILLAGGVMIGFGSRMAGGCPSGHALGGLSVLSPASLIAIAGYFASGITLTLFLRWLML